MTLCIHPIPAFQDNYIWTIHNETNAIVVDPGESTPVENYLAKHQLKLQAILITHHHHDHINGIESLLQQWNCDVYGPADSRIQCKYIKVKEQDLVAIDALKLNFKVIETPGHTLTHICYFNDKWLFSGDTLFSIGCGRMFEGTAEMYVESLQKLKQLDAETALYCTHEYTSSNLDFALAIEPENPALLAYNKQVSELRSAGKVSLPSSLKTELKLNPFLRANDPILQKHLTTKFNQHCGDEVSCFALLRKLKDNF
jgi:hydroxyacylglutathione hydrolase